MYSVAIVGKYIEMYLNEASTSFRQAEFDYPLDACLIQVISVILVKITFMVPDTANKIRLPLWCNS